MTTIDTQQLGLEPTENQLNVKTLESWLWDAAYQIRGQLDAPSSRTISSRSSSSSGCPMCKTTRSDAWPTRSAISKPRGLRSSRTTPWSASIFLRCSLGVGPSTDKQAG